MNNHYLIALTVVAFVLGATLIIVVAIIKLRDRLEAARKADSPSEWATIQPISFEPTTAIRVEDHVYCDLMSCTVPKPHRCHVKGCNRHPERRK